MSRIDVNIAAEDQTEGDFVARLVTAALNSNGFEDVTSMGHSNHQETEDDVVAAMRSLHPDVFVAEITVGVVPFEEETIDASETVVGDSEFAPPEDDDDD